MSSFHKEWVTIGRHRVLLECRDSFPDSVMREDAEYAVELCEKHASEDARVVRLFYDDKACVLAFEVASTRQEDPELAEKITMPFHARHDHGGFITNVTVYAEGDRQQSHYDHMRHLSEAAGVYDG